MTKNVVITGSTRGIGLGLAEAFLALDCNVIVSSRSHESVEQAVHGLCSHYDEHKIFGVPCDTIHFDQIEHLWQRACAQFGEVHIWINNAGVAHRPQKPWEQSADVIKSVIETNVLGAMYGSKIATQGMLMQGFGSLYNMEGMGSDGRRHEGLTYYGSSKYCLHYYNQALIEETRGTAVLVGIIRPGMVLTDLITGQFKDREKEWEQFKPIFNLLADRVENVAPWIADRILKNKKHGASIEYMNNLKLMSRFVLAAFGKRRNLV
jgi:NAD(P)-dependent dehydrogenase (short-subunit alcohol dehydrogenase family)